MSHKSKSCLHRASSTHETDVFEAAPPPYAQANSEPYSTPKTEPVVLSPYTIHEVLLHLGAHVQKIMLRDNGSMRVFITAKKITKPEILRPPPNWTGQTDLT